MIIKGNSNSHRLYANNSYAGKQTAVIFFIMSMIITKKFNKKFIKDTINKIISKALIKSPPFYFIKFIK